MKKNLLILIFGLIMTFCYSQEKIDIKEEKFKQQIDTIVEELKFNYEYDQALREYIIYKTFDKSITDSIENLENEKDRLNYIFSTNFKSDLAKRIWKEFIHPSDDKFTERLIAISDSVGYPSLKRIKKYYDSELPEEFNPTIFFVHSQEKYWEKINEIAEREFKNGNMGKCDYGYIRWHTSGRKENKYLDENGIKYGANSKGRAVYIQTCEDK
ncbi:hypothetical protein DFQ11_1253 [Winogradskyella epiphytica]|uniref:Uncharacterized protein n=1 Tax=Winogradskyella epiphytica TaxID=262005 RepID=A0A2V4XVZ3_9FLAO|nr:hypothetical protein [Winogradskyella epiphytica]PYE78630.1 hypothetical protein DFQ11_1253 [Winogradskyella epiphytica]GGW75495.1 hypothetical protein GCM10008085_29160 [Winogradskyella epiphytica]